MPYENSTVYQIERYRSRDDGLVTMPVASATVSALRFIRFSSPSEYLRIVWTATREGDPPEVPHPANLDPNNVFLRGEQGAINPRFDPLNPALKIWTLSGVYFYAMRHPHGLATPMHAGKFPFEPGPATVNDIPASVFNRNLTGDTATTFLPLTTNP